MIDYHVVQTCMAGANRQSDFRFRLVLLVSLSFPPVLFSSVLIKMVPFEVAEAA